jgi:pimeloyl-ACP methyl ester carboxylesterase
MTVTQSRIEISRGSLSFFEAVPDGGEARGTVLMVPGLTGSKEDFLPMAPHVTAAGYRLISYSQLGQFDSDGPDGEGSEAEYTIAKFGADVLEVLDIAAPGERVHLLGHSFGGMTTRNAVLREPSRFLSYVILDAPPKGADAGADNLSALADMVRTQGNEGLWDEMFAPLQEMFPSPIKEFLYQRMMTTKAHNLIGIAETMAAEPDLVAELAATGVPALVVAGENDLVSVSVQKDVAERLGVEFELIAGAGHTPNDEKPEELTAVLAAFWNAH